jgi:hypothetical protein
MTGRAVRRRRVRERMESVSWVSLFFTPGLETGTGCDSASKRMPRCKRLPNDNFNPQTNLASGLASAGRFRGDVASWQGVKQKKNRWADATPLAKGYSLFSSSMREYKPATLLSS